ncbi:hypothetical protein HYPSUDRAFT_220222 [Hypholoma sublateritium FD-334 SS-4]|uniref:Uncharacterized protein n=1 Tax=Hypholoma sublateritium (strain FD-334 SS-4) TaxID=945553 RepID=A0A0D2N793_HYPSF|nr:hypothetical protein HYPSUDRAFT_220222 [Hypholoma sublateritium FD-334 SS-4]
MPANPPFASIHALYDDVLLYIFAFNADMFADRQALHNTRIASQGCRQWRNLMLDTPTLWAKLIQVDMDEISKCRTHEWHNELIRRKAALGVSPSTPGHAHLVETALALLDAYARTSNAGVLTLNIVASIGAEARRGAEAVWPIPFGAAHLLKGARVHGLWSVERQDQAAPDLDVPPGRVHEHGRRR